MNILHPTDFTTPEAQAHLAYVDRRLAHWWIVGRLLNVGPRICAYAVGRRLTHESVFEVVWTVGPALILALLAIPSLKLLYSLDFLIYEYEPIITVKAIGHQWFWSYEYLVFHVADDATVSFSAVAFDSYMVPEDELSLGGLRLLEVDNPLFLPTNLYIKFLVTSVDVLHSWAIPALGIKVDAIPGRLNQAFTFIKRSGEFYGQCSEICGVNHGFMPIHIVSVF